MCPDRPVLEGAFAVSPDGKPYLIGSRCGKCGLVAFPRRAVCPSCLAQEMEEAHLGPRGKIETFTIARAAPPGFQAPYVVAQVQLDKGPRIFSQISAKPEDVSLGQEVELEVGPIAHDDQGNTLIGYKFRPI